MIIADLVRLGRIARQVVTDPFDIIQWTTSIADRGARNFYRHVFIVEIARDPSGKDVVLAHPYADWLGTSSTGEEEPALPDQNRACAVPFLLPSGGNPRAPQGAYGVPVYPVYDKDFDEFAAAPEALAQFLRGRLERTVQADNIDDKLRETIAAALQPRFAALDRSGREKLLGVIALCDVREGGGPYIYADEAGGNTAQAFHRRIQASGLYPGRFIQGDLRRIAAGLSEAKFREGASAGKVSQSKGGRCSFCSRPADVVSCYSKVWPWMTTTWEAPLPEPLGGQDLAEAVALCPECYEALTYGAALVSKTTTPMYTWVVQEIFSPNGSAVAAGGAARRSVDPIYGSAYVLPLQQDSSGTDEAVSEELISAYERKRPEESAAAAHFDRLLGLEYSLPMGLAEDHYRLSILYFSGNPGRADIHLRSHIEDVMPSVAMALHGLLDDVKDYAAEVQLAMNPQTSEKMLAFIRGRYLSLPYLLAKAYGGGGVWQALSAALRRQRLSDGPVARALGARIREITHKLPDEGWLLRQEVLFYLTFEYFLARYTKEILQSGEVRKVRPWQELRRMMREAPLDALVVQDVEELGFACGQLVGMFSQRYWMQTKKGDEGQDFLRKRVMTFGSSLTPDAVIRRAMLRFADYGARVGMSTGSIHDILERTGVVLNQYAAMEDQVRRDPDRFMLGFWSGYALAGSLASGKQPDIESGGRD